MNLNGLKEVKDILIVIRTIPTKYIPNQKWMITRFSLSLMRKVDYLTKSGKREWVI